MKSQTTTATILSSEWALAACVLLLALLVASPNWLLVFHIAALAACYWANKTSLQWDPKNKEIYAICFYFFLVPAKLIGIFASIYAWGGVFLMCYLDDKIFNDKSSVYGQHKGKLEAAGCAVWFVIALSVLSVYTIVQIACYALCLTLSSAFLDQLAGSYGRGDDNKHYALLFSSLLIMPFLCHLSELSVSHLICHSLAAGVLGYCHSKQSGHQQTLVRLCSAVSQLVCQTTPTVLLGFHPWAAVYLLAVTGCASIAGLNSESVTAKFGRAASQVYTVGSVTALLALPWFLFGLKSYLTCGIFLIAFGHLTEKLFKFARSASNPQLVEVALQCTAFGILLPKMLF